MTFENFTLILKNKLDRSRGIQEDVCFLLRTWYSLILCSKMELNISELKESSGVHKTYKCVVILEIAVLF